MRKFSRWARTARDADPENPTGGGGQQGKPDEGQQQGGKGTTDKGFPENTPVADMTAEQQAKYWQHQARKHEDRAKKALSPQEAAELKRKADEYDKQQQAQMSELEKATALLAEKDAKLQQFEAQQVRISAATAAGLSLDLVEFITATDADTAKEQAERLKSKLAVTNHSGVPQGFQGEKGGKTSSVAAGRERYEARKKKTT